MKKPRLLIADDHPDLVKTLTRVLAADCEIIGTVADGGAALETAQRLKPDVMLLDLSLANVNSLELCRQITHINPDTKVIVFTAMDDPYLRQRALEVGASAFVCKVGDDTDLRATIRRLFADQG
jgi:two-component system response regulator NreC